MILFVTGNFFRRRRTPKKRQTDDVPAQPLVEFVAFWTLLSVGAFCLVTAGFALFAGSALGFQLTHALTVVMIAVGLAGIGLIQWAFVFWWRLRS